MKKAFSVIIVLFLFGLLFVGINYREDITKYIVVNYIYKKDNEILKDNEYKKDLNISYVKETDNFFPQNKQDLLNIFYTAFNSDSTDFTYYCLDSYPTCIKDSNSLINEQETLSIINNLVHPYNSYQSLSFAINSFGKVHVTIEKQYSDEMIKELNKKVDEIIASQIKDNMSVQDKIKTIHDYIINHSTYDRERADAVTETKENTSPYHSESAYGALIEGHAICSGYSDAMELFLNRFGITSYKISSPTHIWNLVNIDGTWKHLDLTWDNPVVNTGEKMLLYDFYLIDTKKLLSLDKSHHTFNQDIYQEAA